MKKVGIVGSGFSSLSCACYLAKFGFEVSVFEKNSDLGGRARSFQTNGFTFDMGPSWYWMPDVFDRFFNDFGVKSSDFYELLRLDPSYKVFFDDGDLDMYLSRGRQPNYVLWNDGNATFSDSGQRFGEASSLFAAVGDPDIDGDLDVGCFVYRGNNDRNGTL